MKNIIKYVYVNYDPLYECVVCVHDKPNEDCDVCKPIKQERWDNKNPYFLMSTKLPIKTKYI